MRTKNRLFVIGLAACLVAVSASVLPGEPVVKTTALAANQKWGFFKTCHSQACPDPEFVSDRKGEKGNCGEKNTRPECYPNTMKKMALLYDVDQKDKFIILLNEEGDISADCTWYWKYLAGSWVYGCWNLEGQAMGGKQKGKPPAHGNGTGKTK